MLGAGHMGGIESLYICSLPTYGKALLKLTWGVTEVQTVRVDSQIPIIIIDWFGKQ